MRTQLVERLRLPALGSVEALRAVAALAGLVLALVMIWGAQQELGAGPLTSSTLARYGGGLLIILVLDWLASGPLWRAAGELVTPERAVIDDAAAQAPSTRFVLPNWLALAAALLGGILVWLLMRGRGNQDSYGIVALMWILSMAAAVAATLPLSALARGERTGPVLGRGLPATDWAIVGVICGVALLLRVIALDRIPLFFSGDEASVALGARAMMNGEYTNPFGTGWAGAPTLNFFVESLFLRILGDSPVGARAVSALVGTVAVLFTYLLARRLFDRPVAIAAATLLAAFHLHVHLSRIAIHIVGDTFYIASSLYFFDRALVERRRVDAVITGILIGMSQYSYFGSRLIPFIALAYVGFSLLRVRWARAQGATPNVPRPSILGLVFWVVLGAVLAFLPLLVYYVERPAAYLERVSSVTILTSGWIQQQQQAGRNIVEALWSQFWYAALLPFYSNPSGIVYGFERPWLGFPMALALAVGLTLATLGAWRRSFFPLAAAYWAGIVGLALTVDPSQGQRIGLAVPMMAIFAGVGLVAIMRVAVRLGRVPRLVGAALLSVTLAALVVWNFQYYFLAPELNRRYGNEVAIAITLLGYDLRGLGPDTTVHFFGAPRIFYYGQPNLPFLAPGSKGVDVVDTYGPQTTPPDLTGRTVFAVFWYRAAELDVVRGWFPDGLLRDIGSVGDAPAIKLYEVRPS